jgi:putative ABC transport system substrate-binding protein
MRRRGFARLVVGAAAWPLPAGAQKPSKIPTIGVLVVGSPGSDAFWRFFRDGMRDLGHVDGRTVRYEFRSDGGQASRLPELAAELVRLNVDAIVVWFTPAATAAKRATSTIPIVMALVGDPVATGLVESLSRPGGNITGMTGAGGITGKGIQLLRDMLPAARRVAALINANDPFSKPFLASIESAGSASGTTIEPVMIREPAELDGVFMAFDKNRPDALIMQPSLPLARVAALALKHRIPSTSTLRAFAEEGGLMSYWYEQRDLYRRSAAIVDRILKGARPADIPVELPTRYELVINLKTAKALGIAVPQALLAQADDLIE